MKVGIFLRGINPKIHDPPLEMAKKCADHGVSFVPIMIFWQGRDGNKNVNSSSLVEYAAAFENVGIDTGIWVYPWCGREEGVIHRIQWALERAPIRLISLDPELGYQGYKVGRESAANGAERLITGVIDVMTEAQDLDITSFGCAHMHKTFPWEEMCAGIGSPQFYFEESENEMKAGFARWVKAGWKSFMPAIPTFGPNSDKKLLEYAYQVFECGRESGALIDGCIFWSLRQTDRIEWDEIKFLAEL